MRQILFLGICITILSGCRSSHIITAWKNQKPAESYGKIMVVAIIDTTASTLKAKIEKDFAAQLKALGYNTVTSVEEFGEKGLANMAQEKTYQSLCDKNIDAVITLTLIDLSKEKRNPRRIVGYPANYYYDRIWNYKNITADLSDQKVHGKLFWESILFNLRTLESEITIQTKPSSKISTQKMNVDFDKGIIKRLLKEKVLGKPKATAPKAA